MFKNIYIKMAWHNISRRKTRTFMMAGMIAATLIGLLLMQGIYTNMIEQITINTIKSDVGAVLISAKNYRQSEELKYYIKKPEKVINILNKTQHIKSYVLRIKAQGIIATAGYSKGVSILGIDLANEDIHSNIQHSIIDGTYSFGARDRGALIGWKLAKKLKVKVGKKIIITTQDIDNEVVSIALRVKAIIKTNNMSIDSSSIYMKREKLSSLINLDGINQIAIMLDDRHNAQIVKNSLVGDINNKELVVYSYNDIYPQLKQSEDIMKYFSTITSGFMFLVAALGIFGVVLVSVLDRIREFGIMLAIGTKFKDIAKMIIYESLFIALLGYLIGSLLGFLLLYYLKIVGLDLSSLSDAFAIFGMDSSIRASIKLEYFITPLISTIIATLLATISPIRTLKKRRPIEAIKDIF